MNILLDIGQTILIGDIARIDIKHISNDVLVSLSFMTTSHLPINVIETKDDEKFYEKTLEKDQLEVNNSPQLCGPTIEILGIRKEEEDVRNIVLLSAS
ncbi:unnamed protein product [Rotaria sordida]|uniref:Uncharacterized protein n=1 Tax=Rotaria sordida TaxID=392033 RepID=A0A815PAI2_9BILA|nr:unnamed protein product [Rotaria sordida]